MSDGMGEADSVEVLDGADGDGWESTVLGAGETWVSAASGRGDAVAFGAIAVGVGTGSGLDERVGTARGEPAAAAGGEVGTGVGPGPLGAQLAPRMHTRTTAGTRAGSRNRTDHFRRRPARYQVAPLAHA